MATFPTYVVKGIVLDNTVIWFFIVVMPVLIVSFGYFAGSYYIEHKKTQEIIHKLILENTKILDKNKQKDFVDFKKTNWLRSKLNFAGFLHYSAEYVFIMITLGFGVLSAVLVYLVIPSFITLIVCFLLFSMFPYIVLSKIISMRQEEFNVSLKELIDKVTSMMKSGVGFEQALRKAVSTCKSQFAQDVFNIYLNEKDIIGEVKAFEKMFILVDSKELRIFYLTIMIGRQSGGKFSNTLDKLRKTLADQGELKQEIISSTKEVKVGTYMILGLVVFIYYMMNMSLENSLNAHFFGSTEGKIQLFFISLWVAFGLFVNNLLTKVK
jgi:tight adherence protein B